MKNKMTRKAKTIWGLILLGFCAMEFPGVLIVGDKAYPFLFGFPFLYGYILFWWLYMCVVILYAYRNNWGRNR